MCGHFWGPREFVRLLEFGEGFAISAGTSKIQALAIQRFTLRRCARCGVESGQQDHGERISCNLLHCYLRRSQNSMRSGLR